DGTVIAWGDNAYGKTNVPAGLDGVIGIAAGAQHAVALKNNGTVVAWGWSPSVSVPAAATNVAAISALGNNSLALRNDGTVIGWPSDGPPAGLNGIAAVSRGDLH